MKFNFDKKTQNFLEIITKNAQNQKMRVFFVGGIVRDNYLNIPIADIDLIIEGNAIQFAKNLDSQIKIKSTHEDFCTVKLEYQNLEIDLASTRIEKYPYSNCLPQVIDVGVPIEQDYIRRDFSVNSLYCELVLINNELKFNLIDLSNGISDIDSKVLKVLHSKSYIDDNTRIIRGLGFKNRFGFNFSNEDKILIQEALKNIEYEKSSFDRTLDVFKKVLARDESLNIFNEIIENKFYKILSDIELKIDLDRVESAIQMFKLNQQNKASFLLNILLYKKIEKIILNSKVEYRKQFMKFNLVQLATYFYFNFDENIFDFIKTKNITLFVAGDDLLQIGYKQGKILGEIFDSLLEEKICNQNNFKTKDDEISWILQHFPKN